NIAVIVDLTARREAEEKKLRSQEDAKREAAGRKQAEKALADIESQLRQNQKMEAVGRLAGGVAHDFNNMLSVILGYSEMLLMDIQEGDRLFDDVNEIRTAGLRAADLTRQLLAFSRQQVMEVKVLDLNETLVSLERMLRRLIGEDLALHLHLAPS